MAAAAASEPERSKFPGAEEHRESIRGGQDGGSHGEREEDGKGTWDFVAEVNGTKD